MLDREATQRDQLMPGAAAPMPAQYGAPWPKAGTQHAPSDGPPVRSGAEPASPSPGMAPVRAEAPCGATACLAERIAAAQPTVRAAILADALAVGEPIALRGAELRGIDLRPGRATRRQAPQDPGLRPRVFVLDGADLTGATLSGANLAGVSLRGVALDGALLVGADLTGADLTGATLRSANLTGARLARADLSYADLRGASLLTAHLGDAIAVGADLRDALLQSANLRQTILRAADLRWARLTGANLVGADVRDARFEGAIMAMANCSDARLSPSTDFGLAFLYQARLERSGLARRNLAQGIGEVHTDLSLAAETYRALARTFAGGGRGADARWAHRQAQRMATSTHRLDRAPHFHTAPWPGSPASVALFHVRHAARWLSGVLADAATGYGTCAVRLLGTLVLSWLAFAAYFSTSDGIGHAGGRLTTDLDALRFSAASLTPMDAYPLIAVTDAARWVAAAEGLTGMFLLGALGFVVASRLRNA